MWRQLPERAGSVDTPKPLPAATHSRTVGQLTSNHPRLRPPRRRVGYHVVGPPAGLVDAKIAPSRSTATHRRADGHETPVKSEPSGSIVPKLHVPEPPAGSVDVKTSPLWSTATHNDTDAHDTPERSEPRSVSLNDHVAAPPAGSVDV